MPSEPLPRLRELPQDVLDVPCKACGHPAGIHWQPYGGKCTAILHPREAFGAAYVCACNEWVDRR